MNTQNILHLNQAQSALYQLELLQAMAKAYDKNDFPVNEYAYIVDTFVQTISKHLELITTTK